MDEKMKEVFFELAASHAALAAQEYNRNTKYNNTHFSYKADEHVLSYVRSVGLENEYLQYYKEFKENLGIRKPICNSTFIE